MSRLTPEQEARYALNFGVARSDLPKAAQLAYDRLVEEEARARPAAQVQGASTQTGLGDPPPRPFSRVELIAAAATDVIVLAAAVGCYFFVAVTNVASWPANRMLTSAGSGAVQALGVWLMFAYGLLSGALLYGWPSRIAPGEGVLRAMFWGTKDRPSWARLPPSMRRPPWWMWLLLGAGAVGSVVVVAGSIKVGAGKADLRILPGPRYEVSTFDLHNYAWTQVPRATYQAYAAGVMRLDCGVMPFVFVLIAILAYGLYLRCELLRSGRQGGRLAARPD
jgi:hypothetical protein